MRKFKGIELPVNAVIIIALAIFVLLMLAAFFGKSSEGFTDTQYQSAFYSACAQWSSGGCSDNDFNQDKIKTSMNDGKNAFSLRQVCQSYLKDPSADVTKCKNACTSCPKKFVGEGTQCKDIASTTECSSLLTDGWKCLSAGTNGDYKGICCPSSKTAEKNTGATTDTPSDYHCK